MARLRQTMGQKDIDTRLRNKKAARKKRRGLAKGGPVEKIRGTGAATRGLYWHPSN